jgi:hypothetical protein
MKKHRKYAVFEILYIDNPFLMTFKVLSVYIMGCDVSPVAVYRGFKLS